MKKNKKRNMWRKLAFSIWAELWGFVFSLPFVWKTFSHEELLHLHRVELINPFLTKTVIVVSSFSHPLCTQCQFSSSNLSFLWNTLLLRCELEIQLSHLPPGGSAFVRCTACWGLPFILNWFEMPVLHAYFLDLFGSLQTSQSAPFMRCSPALF